MKKIYDFNYCMMMSLKKVSVCFFLVITMDFYCQEQPAKELKSILTFSTFSPTMSYAPRWNFGYMRKFNDRYWYEINFGYGNDAISINFDEEGGWITNIYNLYEFRPELYYDLKPNSRLKQLVSVELFYINHTDKFQNNWFYDLNEHTYYTYDSADYKRIKFGFTINYNLIYNISKKIALMQKTGIGFRNRKVIYSNIVNKTEDPNFDDDSGGIFATNTFLKNNGVDYGVNFNLDLKIIYKF